MRPKVTIAPVSARPIAVFSSATRPPTEATTSAVATPAVVPERPDGRGGTASATQADRPTRGRARREGLCLDRSGLRGARPYPPLESERAHTNEIFKPSMLTLPWDSRRAAPGRACRAIF